MKSFILGLVLTFGFGSTLIAEAGSSGGGSDRDSEFRAAATTLLMKMKKTEANVPRKLVENISSKISDDSFPILFLPEDAEQVKSLRLENARLVHDHSIQENKGGLWLARTAFYQAALKDADSVQPALIVVSKSWQSGDQLTALKEFARAAGLAKQETTNFLTCATKSITREETGDQSECYFAPSSEVFVTDRVSCEGEGEGIVMVGYRLIAGDIVKLRNGEKAQVIGVRSGFFWSADLKLKNLETGDVFSAKAKHGGSPLDYCKVVVENKYGRSWHWAPSYKHPNDIVEILETQNGSHYGPRG